MVTKIVIGAYNKEGNFYPLQQSTISGDRFTTKFHNLFLPKGITNKEIPADSVESSLEGRSIYYEYSEEKRGENPFECRIDDKPLGIYRYSHLSEPGEVVADINPQLFRDACRK